MLISKRGRYCSSWTTASTLLDACARLARAILRAAPEPTIISTSREPLQVAGEQSYPLRTLSLPEPSASGEAIARSDAVQLFVERARKQLPDFALTAAQAPTVAALCIHLDGIPLALELAAARVRSLSIEQINARLNDRFKLLTSGSRTALPRQQTLRATLDWSFELLAEAERVVLRRLAVFPGSFTLEAASSVASDEMIDEYAVIDLIRNLSAPLAGHCQHERFRRALPPAGDHPCLCIGKARRGRRNRRHQTSSCAALS